MATIANISVALTARTRKFEKAFKRVSRKITRFGRHVARVGTIAAAAITVPMIAAVKHFATVGDAAAKMAKRTGISVRALTQLGHIAKLTGTELSSVEKAVKRMAKAIVDGSQGMTTYVRAFDLIGLQAEDLMGLSPEEAFFKIGGAVGDLTDSIKQQAAAQDLFGKAGTKLIPLFKEGTKGMRAMKDEADALGISFDLETAQKAEKLVDALYKVTAAAGGLVRMFGEALGPGITQVAQSITDNWGSVRTLFISSFHEIGIEGMRWWTSMQTVADSMAGGFKTVTNDIRGYFLDAFVFIGDKFASFVNVIITGLNKITGLMGKEIGFVQVDPALRRAAKFFHDEADKLHQDLVVRRMEREAKFFAWEAQTRAGYLKLLEQTAAGTATTITELAKQGAGGIGGLAGAMKRPGALEAGTVGAYKAGVADPAYRGMDSKLGDLVKESKEQTKILRVTNQHLVAAMMGIGTLTPGLGDVMTID